MSQPEAPARVVEVEGRRLYLRDQGEGPVLLLVHGIPTSGELWREVVPELNGRARILVPDLLGYGRSDDPGGLPLGIDAHARYLVAVLDALGVERATVVGHDIGGGVAQIIATRHPGRVERLGLIDSVCYDSWPIPEMRAIQLTAPVVERLPSGLTAEGLKMVLRRGFLHAERAEAYLDDFLARFATPEGLDLFVEHARALDSRHTEEIAPLLPAVRVPAAVAWGRHDPFQKPHWAERLAGDLPAAELTWLEASHFSPADAPRAVAQVLTRLLERER